MDGNIEECRKKFQKTLDLLDVAKSVSDDTYLEKIQSYLESDEYSGLVKEPETKMWINKVFNAFDNLNNIPSQQITIFALKLTSNLCTNEWSFVEMKDSGLLDKIKSGIEQSAHIQKPAIKLSHLQLLHSISQHSLGLHWLKQTKCWDLVIKYYEMNGTIYIVREASNFFYNILTKFSELMKDQETCIEALESILKPILNYNVYQKDAMITVDDEEFAKELIPSINIVSQILWLCIESKKRSRLAYYILLKYRFENRLWVLQDAFQTDTTFLTAIIRAHNIANFCRLSSMEIPASDEKKASDLSFDMHAIHFYNLLKFCMTKRAFKNINMIAEMHHQLWYKLGDRAPKEVVLENHDLKFGDQVILTQTFPILDVIRSRYKANDEYINDMCTKMFNMSCEHTIRLLYQYRDALSHENFDFVADLAAHSIQSIIATKKYLKRDRATLAFQILIHVLKGYVDDYTVDENGKITNRGSFNVQLVLQAPNLLSTLLNALNEMINSFKFTWKDCIESSTVIPLLLALLENPNLSSRQTIETFKLIQTSIEHFLAPNLALLMDKIEGSEMETLGPTIYKRLHDISWEVRDTVLELLFSIVEISNEKFPPFQKHILQNKICQTVEIIARNDSEPYVRASAFKVLGAMIKIRMFWEHVLHELDVKKYVVEVLGCESEGVVRKEAVACINAIYNHQYIPISCLDIFFSVLTHCAVNDFYWEVKVNALDLWQTVINKQFEHQGMIDGTFPAVTFSKEQRKIITLNDKEIQLRLRKVLNELALRGCLGILITCLEDSDLEVIKKVVSIVEKMMGYLNKYSYIEEYNKLKAGISSNTVKPVIDSNYADFVTMDLSKNTDARNLADYSKNTEVTMSAENGEICSIDKVIDSILQTDDITLLSITYKENLDINRGPCKMGKIDENIFKKYATVTADDFLNFITSTDLQQLIRDKSEWLHHSETFSTLLDDVLSSFRNEVDLDCY